MRRLQLDRSREAVHRLFQVVARLENDAEIAVPVGLIGRELETAPHERDRLVPASVLVREHAEVVERSVHRLTMRATACSS